VRLVVDAQLPPALAKWLVAQGHDAVHVFDLDYARAPDLVIWEHAREIGAVIITKDEDFALRVQLRPSGPPVIWIRF
jgi:predicted nuclease of predicted toxin-antitoxin system